MNIYLESFGIFFKIGAFTIGGGYAMVPLIENEIVTKRKWIAQDDFIDLLAISQSAPGILAVNISIFIGYKLRGIRGSIVTALGTILPSFIIILAIALFFHNFSTFLGRAGLYLEDLYVRPEHRGKGYGKAFFRRLAAIAAERDCGRLEWWCLDWNTPSIGFYKSLGAETMEDWTVYRLTGPALQRLAEPESPVAETDEI